MAQINKPNLHFNTNLYTGNGSTQHSITGVGFQPDLVWIKGRGSTYSHFLFDAVRGAGKQIYSNATTAEGTNLNNLYSFDSDGFSLAQSGNDDVTNQNNINFVSWNWKAGNSAGSSNTDGNITSTVSANTTAGISIVTWTGTGNAQTVGHGLGSAPNMIILKERSATSQWQVSNDGLGWTKRLNLDDTSAADTTSYIWNDTAPTSSVFSIGTSGAVTENGQTYVAYCFAEKKGFSKFGTYDAIGASNDGPFIYTGFPPAFVMLKRYNSTENWYIFDDTRDTINPINTVLYPNLTNADGSLNGGVDLLSNGFKIRTNNAAIGAGDNYIFMAFAAQALVGTNNVAAVAR